MCVYLRLLEIFWRNKELQVKGYWLHWHGCEPVPQLVHAVLASDQTVQSRWSPVSNFVQMLVGTRLFPEGIYLHRCFVVGFQRILPMVPSVECQGSNCHLLTKQCCFFKPRLLWIIKIWGSDASCFCRTVFNNTKQCSIKLLSKTLFSNKITEELIKGTEG